MPAATLIPVASGKGGVGKSLLAVHLGIALARRGQSVILADLDLGGSNLHTYLGKPISSLGIAHFIHHRPGHLEECIEDTQVPGLRLLAGDGVSPLMANLPYAQKHKLIRHLGVLEADFVLLDLSAGSSLTTLDFFAIAERGLLVTTADSSALINLLSFLKNLMFRLASRDLPAKDLAKRKVQRILRDLECSGLNYDELLSKVEGVSPESAARMRSRWDRYLPRVVFNMVRHPDELKLCTQLDAGLGKRLNKTLEYFGFVFDDPQVRTAARHGNDGIIACAGIKQDVDRLAERIISRWSDQSPDSAKRLYQDCSAIYSQP